MRATSGNQHGLVRVLRSSVVRLAPLHPRLRRFYWALASSATIQIRVVVRGPVPARNKPPGVRAGKRAPARVQALSMRAEAA